MLTHDGRIQGIIVWVYSLFSKKRYHGYDDMIDKTTMTEDIEDPNFAIPASIDALASSRVRPSPFTVMTDKIGMFSSKFHGGFQLFSIILVEWDIIQNVRQYLAAFWVLCNLNLRHDHPHQFPPDSSQRYLEPMSFKLVLHICFKHSSFTIRGHSLTFVDSFY